MGLAQSRVVRACTPPLWWTRHVLGWLTLALLCCADAGPWVCWLQFYCAPEVALEGHGSMASDLWSFGVIMWCVRPCCPSTTAAAALRTCAAASRFVGFRARMLPAGSAGHGGALLPAPAYCCHAPIVLFFCHAAAGSFTMGPARTCGVPTEPSDSTHPSPPSLPALPTRTSR